MKSPFLISLLFLMALTGCGDPATSRRGPGEEVFTPALNEDDFIVTSQLHRMKGTEVISSREERDVISGGTLPEGYRIIPSMLLDDEGTNGKNINTRSGLQRPEINCGTNSGLSISQRITNCAENNGARSAWSPVNGAAGEAHWKLVAKSGTAEMWLDTRTGHLWSDIIDTTNWCNAAGKNTQETGASVNCQTHGTNFTCVGKSILGLTGITWRLPTRNDFLQADLDGLRFVLKESGTLGFWTATMDSMAESRNQAWAYVQSQGTLETVSLTSDRQVRCIGAAAL